MTVVTPSRRGSGRNNIPAQPSNSRKKSPTRSQRKEDRLPKRHYNIFDQTLLPEEDFSGSKLLRKRKTSGNTDPEPPSKRRKTLSPNPKNDEDSNQIQVSTTRRRIPQRPVSQPVSALQQRRRNNNETPPPRPSSSSQVGGIREFRSRDKAINYTIPSLKSILPTPPPPRKRRSSAPPTSSPILVPKKIPPEIPPSTPAQPSPRPVGRPKLRTITQRNGEKMLLIKLRIASNKLAPLVRTPRIRIVEGSTRRKRRIREEEVVEEEQPVEQKRESEKPFGGILTKQDGDTSKTTPTEVDRARFDRARDAAIAHAQTQPSITVARSASEVPSSAGGHPIAETAFKIRAINFGNYRVKTHYASPYPEEYSRQSVLGICEFCLKYMTGEWVGWRHRLKCPVKHPPGDEIYRDGKISVFEVDGRKNPVYCQNLCLLAKMYLDHKTLYYDVEPFLFYVLCECDDRGCHFVGYFSKEKRSMAGYNLSCIVTLPIYQRKGYGFFLISFSYLLSQRENRLGSPEKPLSDLGLLSYRSYWKTALAAALIDILDRGINISIQELGKRTGMTDDDVVSGLEGLDALVKDLETGIYAIKVNPEKLVERVELVSKKGYVKVKEEVLKWTPYLLGRKEARDMLEGGLEELIHQRMTSSGSLDQNGVPAESESVEGKDIPIERFVSVTVPDLVPPPRITYDTPRSQTPIPTSPQIPSEEKSPSTSTPEEDILDEDPNISSPSSTSVNEEEEEEDEPYSAEEEEEEEFEEEDEVSDENSEDYISDDSDAYRRNNRQRNRSSQASTPQNLQEVVVRVKQVAKAPKNRSAAFVAEEQVKTRPKVIAAKAPRSRAGRNPPEVMSRRAGLRNV